MATPQTNQIYFTMAINTMKEEVGIFIASFHILEMGNESPMNKEGHDGSVGAVNGMEGKDDATNTQTNSIMIATTMTTTMTSKLMKSIMALTKDPLENSKMIGLPTK